MRKGRKTLMCPSVGQPMEVGHNSYPLIITTHGDMMSHYSKKRRGKICIIIIEL